MNRSQIEAAIKSGNPFSRRMADGNEYKVPHQDYISLSPKGTFATVYNDNEGYYVLPLITMTGIVASNVESSASTEG